MANKAIPAAVKTALAYRPEPPASLTGSERARWTELVKRFNGLSESDIDALVILVQSMEQAETYRKQINDMGDVLTLPSGVQYLNPLHKILSVKERTILNLLGKLGGTPASRPQNALSDAVSTSFSDDKLKEFLT